MRGQIGLKTRGFMSTSTRRLDQTEPALNVKSGGPGARNAEFYDLWNSKRVYFYQVDLRGRLFLDTPNLLRRNDATCLKSREFLDFFFKRVKPCPTVSGNVGASSSPGDTSTTIKSDTWREAIALFSHEYPFMSPCGKELNLLKAEDTPIVFRDLVENQETGVDELLFGGSLREPFDPSRLSVGRATERIYYTTASGTRCLVHADLAQRLSKGFSSEGEDWWEYKGTRYPLPLT